MAIIVQELFEKVQNGVQSQLVRSEVDNIMDKMNNLKTINIEMFIADPELRPRCDEILNKYSSFSIAVNDLSFNQFKTNINLKKFLNESTRKCIDQHR